MTRSPRPVEEFSPFDKARLNNGVPNLDEKTANALLVEVERRIGSGRPFEDEMEFVLDLNEVWDADCRKAYKSYFGYVWAERKRRREKGRDEAFKREFAPLDEDGNQY